MYIRITSLLAMFMAFGVSAQTFTQTYKPFQDSIGYIRGISWGDIDGDGDQDVYLSGYYYSGGWHAVNHLYMNDGSANFTLSPQLSSVVRSYSNAFGDLDNDGDMDVMLLKYGSNTETHMNNGATTFSMTAPMNGSSLYQGGLSLGDYDNDGDLDAYLSRWNNASNILYRNNGNGTYTSVSSGGVATDAGWTSNGIWGDMDNDNDLDLYVINYQEPNNLYINDGSGNFTKSTTAGTVITHNQNSRDGNWVDYDDDGYLDLFVVNQGSSNRLYRNNGNGTFTETTPAGIASGTSWSSNWGDYDNDGDQDFMTIGSWSTAHQFWQNNGGTFTQVNPGCLPNAGSGSNSTTGLFTDVNGDGWLDVHVLFPGSVNDFFYLNEGSVCKNWVEFDLLGSTSNTHGIGAKISVKAAVNGTSVWQHRSVTGQSSKVGHQMMRSHFGLGDATVIDSILVAWPSGATCTITNVDVNQIATISEASCALAPSTGPLPDCFEAVLPVEMMNYTVSCENGFNVLRWQTATELNNDYFEIQRSFDGISFKTIDQIDGAGTTEQMQSYQWSERASQAVSYYRLKQVDFNGEFVYSDIRSSNCSLPTKEITVYPNPTIGVVNIAIPEANSAERIQFIDQTGRVVENFEISMQQDVYTFNTAPLETGVYTVKVFFADQVETQRLIVEKE